MLAQGPTEPLSGRASQPGAVLRFRRYNLTFRPCHPPSGPAPFCRLRSGHWSGVSAQQSGQRAIVWSRAEESASGLYRTVTDGSGLVEVDTEYPTEVDSDDLAAVCRGKDAAIRRATTRAEQDLRQLGNDDDPSTSGRRSRVQLRLGAIATFQGDMDRAAAYLTRRVMAWRCSATTFQTR